MWELDCEEGWAPKNWCFWTVVLEKTLETPLDCKEIETVHSEEDQPWDFFGRNDAKAETRVLSPPYAKCWLIGKDSDPGKDWGQEEMATIEDEMTAWHHWLDGRESEWTPGDGDGQGGLACCNSRGRKELDTTEQLNWTELIPIFPLLFLNLWYLLFCFWLTSLCMTEPRPVHTVADGILPFFSNGWMAVHCVCEAHLLYPPFCWRPFVSRSWLL